VFDGISIRNAALERGERGGLGSSRHSRKRRGKEIFIILFLSFTILRKKEGGKKSRKTLRERKIKERERKGHSPN